MSGKIILDDQKKLILKANNKILIQKYLLVNRFFAAIRTAKIKPFNID